MFRFDRFHFQSTDIWSSYIHITHELTVPDILFVIISKPFLQTNSNILF